MRSFRLSKSRIAAGLQCPRRLWLAVHRPDLARYDAETQRRFGSGDDVGRLARRLYAPGRLVACDDNLSQAVRDTAAALAVPGDLTLFEAAFRHRDVLVRSDVLVRRAAAYGMIEVKSATRVKEHHLQDVAIQAWVTEGAGVPLGDVSVAVVDTDFVYRGGGEYDGLLREIPVADQVRPLMADIPAWVRGLSEMLGGPLPAAKVGQQCQRPFACPFAGFCREREGLPPASAGRAPTRTARAGDPSLASVGTAATAYLETLPYPRTYLDF